MRNVFTIAAVVAVCCMVAPSASAESLGSCTLTGYTFMGGYGVYTNAQRDYFLTGTSPTEDAMWAFGWVKFSDLPTATVEEAWLSIEHVEKSGMYQPSTERPLDVKVRAVNADVADITVSNTADYVASYISADVVATATLTEPGFYHWDITSLVNEWITTGNNYGLVLTAWDDGGDDLDGDGNPDRHYHPYFGGLPNGGSAGVMAPTLATTPAPEPSTVAMLAALGLLAAAAVGRKRRAA